MPEKPRPAERLKYDLTSTFSVVVGAKPHRQRFTVHHDLITQRSEFFRAARSLCWTEPGKVTRLVDDDPYLFSAYLSCLYSGADFMNRQDGKPRQGDSSSGPSADVDDNDGDDDDKMIDEAIAKKLGPYAEHIENVRFLIDIYLLADKFLDPTTANLVIDCLIDFVGFSKWTTGQAIISHVYASTVEGSPLRKLVLDWWLREVDQTWAHDYPKAEWRLPHEFLQDFIIKTCDLRIRNLRQTGQDVFLEPVRAHANIRYHQEVEQKPRDS